jgi:pimeloyl-ACP methyl ester carboxylesterase
MPKLNRDGVNIYYEVHGEGPVILLSHGYSATSQMWRGQIEALSKTHKLVTWDMRGHGQSDYPTDPSQYSEALTVADMAALLDQVGANSAIVGGLSLGGLHVAGVLPQPSGAGQRAPDHRYRAGL